MKSTNKNYEYMKKYREMHKDHLKELTKLWISKNQKHHKELKYQYFASIKGRIQNMIKCARRRAERKNINFNIDIKWLNKLFKSQNNKCSLTNIEFIIPTTRNNFKTHPFTPTLDRINSDLGYTKKNTRLICAAMNYCLYNFGENIFEGIAKAYIYKDMEYLPKIENSYLIKTRKQKNEKKYNESLIGTITRLFNYSKRNAKRKNIDFELTKEFIKTMFEKQNNKCSVSNIEFDYKSYKNKKVSPFKPSIDRIDSSKGYTKENVRLVCAAINFGLNEFGENIFKQICESYINNKNFPKYK